jgi:Asp-tRNA(Asn)/Glu-tRNA(Gln) amidotransferase A subunit family amidase
MTEHWRLTAGEMAAGIREGDLSSEAVVRSCLDRVAGREHEVEAWEWLDPAQALTEARARDAGPVGGPLHGVPVGIKDIIDTADMPTCYGSAIYDGYRPARDAACVAALRAAGAVILGKTVTTEFATYRPGRTRNPHDAGHTPGGSSSGSAAAVAAGMVPLALGSQTVGSVIRPASFCGVFGVKVSQGRLSLDGVKPLASALDSLGCFARGVSDLALWFSALANEPVPARRTEPPRAALIRTAHWDEAAPETRAAVEAVCARLTEAGAQITEPALLPEFDQLAAVQELIFTAGAVTALKTEWRDHRHRLSPQLVAVLERGAAVTAGQLADAENIAQRCRAEMARLFGEVDLVIAPSAPGEAPQGLGATGDPLFNRMWTLLLGPCLNLPAGRGPHGLPVGVQLIGAHGRDAELLRDAQWVSEALGIGTPLPPV